MAADALSIILAYPQLRMRLQESTVPLRVCGASAIAVRACASETVLRDATALANLSSRALAALSDEASSLPLPRRDAERLHEASELAALALELTTVLASALELSLYDAGWVAQLARILRGGNDVSGDAEARCAACARIRTVSRALVDIKAWASRVAPIFAAHDVVFFPLTDISGVSRRAARGCADLWTEVVRASRRGGDSEKGVEPTPWSVVLLLGTIADALSGDGAQPDTNSLLTFATALVSRLVSGALDQCSQLCGSPQDAIQSIASAVQMDVGAVGDALLVGLVQELGSALWLSIKPASMSKWGADATRSARRGLHGDGDGGGRGVEAVPELIDIFLRGVGVVHAVVAVAGIRARAVPAELRKPLSVALDFPGASRRDGGSLSAAMSALAHIEAALVWFAWERAREPASVPGQRGTINATAAAAALESALADATARHGASSEPARAARRAASDAILLEASTSFVIAAESSFSVPLCGALKFEMGERVSRDSEADPADWSAAFCVRVSDAASCLVVPAAHLTRVSRAHAAAGSLVSNLPVVPAARALLVTSIASPAALADARLAAAWVSLARATVHAVDSLLWGQPALVVATADFLAAAESASTCQAAGGNAGMTEGAADDASLPLASAAHGLLAAVAVGAAVACSAEVYGDINDFDGVGQLLAFAGAAEAHSGRPWCAHVRDVAARVARALAGGR